MKREKTICQSFCDFCGKEASGYTNCFLCGKEFCYDCRDKEGITYNQGDHFSSHDGLYCHECDRKALESGDELHEAYRSIKRLNREENGFYVEFKKRQEKAEAYLKQLLRGRK